MPARTSRQNPIVALLTDFGTADHYVASMKGVILGIHPATHFIDISHEIEPGRVRQASFTLWAVEPSLPKGTICAVVVDPGVGTDRPIVIAECGGKVFVAPDNGVLDCVLSDASRVVFSALSRARMRPFLPREISRTFHGRDLIAPAAAQLASGIRPDRLAVKKKLVRPALWKVDGPDSTVIPAILSIDRYGNIITNIAMKDYRALKNAVRAVSIGKVMISVPVEHFSAAPDNTPCMMVGSSGLLEVVIKNGNAAMTLRINDRSPLRIIWTNGGGV